MFDIPLLIYFFTKEHPLKASNERTHIPLVSNQNNITYESSSLEQRMTLVKISLYCILNLD